MSKTSLLSGIISTQPLTSQAELKSRLGIIQTRNARADLVVVERDLTSGEGYGADVSTYFSSYAGGVYSPAQNRIYLAPYSLPGGAGDTSYLHYINCQTNQLVRYSPLTNISVNQSCWGGAYHPVLNRIYFAPLAESNGGNWHYVNCNNDNVTTFASGVSVVASAYQGAVYSNTLNRLYYIPYGVANQTQWHYIDISGVVQSYVHGATVAQYGYSGGVYCPSLDRIFFVPSAQSAFSTWHYLDCASGNVVSYSVAAPGANYFSGAVLDPFTGNLFLTPSSVGVSQANLYYIDTTASVPTLNSFTNPISTGCSGTSGGVYAHIKDMIVFVPGGNALYSDMNFYGLDLSNLSAVSFANPHYNLYNIASAYQGGVFSTTNNTIYFVPYGICYSNLNPILRVKLESKDVVPRQLLIGNLLNS